MKLMLWIGVPTFLALLSGCGATVAENEIISDEMRKNLSVATFAGGCFWCVENGFEALPGVHEAVSGYSGGEKEGPTYRQISAGRTGHTEAVQVYYDPKIISYTGLVQGLWRMMDPTDSGGQFADRGSQYRPAIFYHNAEQKRLAETARARLSASGRYEDPITIEIVPFKKFYQAEQYHQDYYKKSPVRYNLYTFGSGRYQFVDDNWGEERDVDYTKFRDDQDQAPEKMSATDSYSKPSKEAIKEMLSPLQYQVTPNQ